MLSSNSLIDFLDRLKPRKIYVYVPPCPKCGSHETGKLMRKPFMESFYVLESSLRTGELIRFTHTRPSDNCFCEACNHTWYGKISTKFFTRNRIEKEKEARKTDEKLKILLNENDDEEYEEIEMTSKTSQEISFIYLDKELIQETINIQNR